MKKEIENREDVEFLVKSFYQKVMKDDLIGHFFTKVVPLSLEEHLPILFDFWSSILLGSGSYQRNAMIKHIELDRKSEMTSEHFDRWLLLWSHTLDEYFTGEKAILALTQAKQIATLMQYKISANRNSA